MTYIQSASCGSLISAVFILISGILYLMHSASVGAVLVIISLILFFSVIRLRSKRPSSIKDAGFAVLFFGVLCTAAYLILLSGIQGYLYAYIIGLSGSLCACFFGYLGCLSAAN